MPTSPGVSLPVCLHTIVCLIQHSQVGLVSGGWLNVPESPHTLVHGEPSHGVMVLRALVLCIWSWPGLQWVSTVPHPTGEEQALFTVVIPCSSHKTQVLSNEAGFSRFLPCVLLQDLGPMAMQEPQGADLLCCRLTLSLSHFVCLSVRVPAAFFPQKMETGISSCSFNSSLDLTFLDLGLSYFIIIHFWF